MPAIAQRLRRAPSLLVRGVGVVVDRDFLVAHGAPERLLLGQHVGVHSDLPDGTTSVATVARSA